MISVPPGHSPAALRRQCGLSTTINEMAVDWHYGQFMTMRLVGSDLVHTDKHTYMWPWTAPNAQELIQDWADNQNWTDPDFRQPPQVQQRLQDVCALLRSGDLYKLDNPAAEHDWGWVVGTKGFHEFVVIDRSKHRVHLDLVLPQNRDEEAPSGVGWARPEGGGLEDRPADV